MPPEPLFLHFQMNGIRLAHFSVFPAFASQYNVHCGGMDSVAGPSTSATVTCQDFRSLKNLEMPATWQSSLRKADVQCSHNQPTCPDCIKMVYLVFFLNCFFFVLFHFPPFFAWFWRQGLRLALEVLSNSWSSCLSLLSTGAMGMWHSYTLLLHCLCF